MSEQPIKDEAYYESLDKRTKEYKEYIDRKESQEAKEEVYDAIEDALDAARDKKVTGKKVMPLTQSELDEAHAKQSEGLGDTVEKVMEKTGIKKLVKFIAGYDCGCDERKEKLNKLFRYRKPLCLKENEYTFLTEMFSEERNILTQSQQKNLWGIHDRIFQAKTPTQSTNCSSCVRTMYNELRKVYNTYND